MGLTEEARQHLNELVLVVPHYGWGWQRTDPGAQPLSYEEAAGPPPFHARIASFFVSADEVRGASAVIEEKGHPVDGFHVCFSTRHSGNWDFSQRIGFYNVEIGPELLPGTGWPGVTGKPRLSGFAEIRDDTVHQTDLERCVDGFFTRIERGLVEMYNESSLQHELGYHLRVYFRDHKVQFERPVGFFGLEPGQTGKKEMDIAIFRPNGTDRHAVEVKYPRNGQYPEQMFAACQDIAFLESLVRNGFVSGLFVMAVDDRLFYEGPHDKAPYSHFRGGREIHGVVRKPTGARDAFVEIGGSYRVVWKTCGNLRYLSIPVLGADGIGLGLTSGWSGRSRRSASFGE